MVMSIFRGGRDVPC